MFSRTHDMMSGSKPNDPQYPYEEQYEMYLLCEVVLPDDKNKLDMDKTEDNLLELIHYLNENGVPVPAIIGKLKDSGVRCFSTRTQSLAMRLHMRDVRLGKNSQVSKKQEVREDPRPLFLAPAQDRALA